MQEEIGRLRDAVEASTKRKTRKQRYIRTEETLIVSKVANVPYRQAGYLGKLVTFTKTILKL